MARHHPDLIMCRKQPGIAVGRLCEKCELTGKHLGCCRWAHVPPCRARSQQRCTSFTLPTLRCPAGDGKCPICDSYVRPATLVRVCDECNYGSYAVSWQPVGRQLLLLRCWLSTRFAGIWSSRCRCRCLARQAGAAASVAVCPCLQAPPT